MRARARRRPKRLEGGGHGGLHPGHAALVRGDRGGHVGAELGRELVDQRGEERQLAGEVKVERALGDSGRLGNRVHARRVVPFAGKDLHGGREHPAPCAGLRLVPSR